VSQGKQHRWSNRLPGPHKDIANTMKVFHRDEEIDALRRRIASRKSFLLSGPSGVGKTVLLEHLMPEFPEMLYCPQSSSPHAVFRSLAGALVQRGYTAMLNAKGSRSLAVITAVSLKGIVTRVLTGSKYIVVLDHLNRPSHSMAAAVRELMIARSIPTIAVARSAHMEDAGFVAPLFPERTDKLTLKNFDLESAESFVRLLAVERRLVVENFAEFVTRVVEFSDGNPGAIAGMVKMAGMDRYRLGNHVKLSPLYIDFRLQSLTASSERIRDVHDSHSHDG